MPASAIFILSVSDSVCEDGDVNSLTRTAGSTVRRLASLGHGGHVDIVLCDNDNCAAILLPLSGCAPGSRGGFVARGKAGGEATASVAILSNIRGSDKASINEARNCRAKAFARSNVCTNVGRLLTTSSIIARNVRTNIRHVPVVIIVASNTPSRSADMFSNGSSTRADLAEGGNDGSCSTYSFIRFMGRLATTCTGCGIRARCANRSVLLCALNLNMASTSIPALRPRADGDAVIKC